MTKNNVAKLNVSERTKTEIAKFFMKTSVPRIIKKRRKEKVNDIRRNVEVDSTV